uniref:Glutaryl-CoA dehydrogenase n=1 Tax=Thermosporothrix sp. COM3 TaxID=2490863 RepID=A0A455SAH6_9CHLR|nr:glutaryl-CoA dehydrogenase [Thermosporothrix sp. COM3]
MTPETKDMKKKRPIPAPNSDFYQIYDLLSEPQKEVVNRVRTFMETQVAPIIEKYWMEDAFPFELIPGIRDLHIAGASFQQNGEMEASPLLGGFIAMEMARVDCSINTFFGVHSGLAMGSIHLCGSEEQKQRWLPEMADFKKIGCFALTEPLVGSGAAGGLLTTAQRDGDTWILNGQKKWIGNAPFADLAIVWARDVEDNQVKGFIVEKDTPGYSVEKIQNKMALRVVQNGLITLDNCRVPEANRLQNANTFKDTGKILRKTRAGVAWGAVGCMRGAYEYALKYAQEREQFGRPIAKFQLVQDLLFRMLSNITACECLCVRLAQLEEAGQYKDENSAMAKAFCTMKMRETVAYAREIFGGNGILMDYHVARFMADAEALYSYEGTREMNALIVGRAASGYSAFV